MSDAAEAQVRRPPNLAMLRAHRGEILRLAARRGVTNIRVFGSVARGDATPDSDIDLLVDFELRDSGLDPFAFAREVEELLGHPVDVGTDVHRVIRERVEAQAVPL
ncbi:MAG: nucleotidyltransferase family protein [Acidimicrobiales bacterium]